MFYCVARAASTQLEARRRLERGEASVGDVVIADEQTAGRGRFGRSWSSPAGGLYATWILPFDSLLSLRAGVSLANALRERGIPALLKWPNDVLVGAEKIAGILVEAIGEQALVGIGLNLTAAPATGSTCVARFTTWVDRGAWLHAIDRTLHDAGQDDPLPVYRGLCATLGRPVRIQWGDGRCPLDGMAVNVDELGRLVVHAGDVEHRVSSGECLHLRGIAG